MKLVLLNILENYRKDERRREGNCLFYKMPEDEAEAETEVCFMKLN